jgi:exo-beta-1,3-glucanase (GH17 family)
MKRRTALVALTPSVGAAYLPLLPVAAGAEENNRADPARILGASAAAQAVANKLSGMNFGPYMNGQDPSRGTVISQAQIDARLAIIQPYTRAVRTFGVTNGLEAIPARARAAGLDVWAGAWLSNNRAANEREITNLIAIGRTGAAKVLIVGSEVLLRNDLPESELLSYIQRVKAARPAGIRVAYVDTDDVLRAHPKVMAAVDVVMPVIYPYWYGVAIGGGITNVRMRWDKLKAAVGGKELVVAETGWPSAGSARGAAVPSAANAARFFLEFTTWARTNNTPYFYFEAFDEAWKSREGDVGPNWGLFTATGTLKPGMQAAFDAR